MIDKNRISKLIAEIQECHAEDINRQDDIHWRMIAELGDDEEEIKIFLSECSKDELSWLSEIFEYLYEKFYDDSMFEFLENLRTKKLNIIEN